MTQSERLLHRIAGHITNSGYRYLAHAVDLARELSPYPFRRLTTSSWLIKGNKKKGKTNPDGISGRLQE